MKLLSDKTKGVSLILVSSLMFGGYGVLSRLMGSAFEPFYQGWTRALIIVVILFPILYFRKEIIAISKKDWKWFGIYLVFTSLTQAPLYYAFNHMDIGSATMLFFVTMLLTMYLVGFLFLGEKVTRLKIVSFILALVGMYFIFPFSLGYFAVLAALMAILNGVASGGEVAFSKKFSSNYSALYITWLSWLIIFVTNGIISFAIGEVQHLPSLDIVWLYQGLYVVAGIVGFWFIIEGLKYVEASIGGLIGLLEIVFSLIFGLILFSEPLTAKVIMGGLFIIVSASLPHLVDLKKKQS